MKVLDFPLSKFSFLFVIGVLTASFAKISIDTTWIILSIILFLSIFFFLIAKQSKVYSILFGFFSLMLSFGIGFSITTLHDERINENHYSHQIKNLDEMHFFEFLIKEKLKNTKNYNRYIISIQKIDQKESFGKVILNIKRNSNTSEFLIGSNGFVYGSIFKNRNPNNPMQFDYGKYLDRKQIYGQIYSENSKITLSPILTKNSGYYASKFRTTVIQNLRNSGFNETELSILNALVLGQRQDISKEVMQDYQYAGAIHILAVSGLHVGLILLFINLLLKPLPNTNKGRFIKLITSLMALWLFGIIAGLTPSIFRSVVMFSIVAIGMYWRRSTNIYHTLLVSMMVLLFINPFYLFDIGFQLSYVALFSIVWIQPIFMKLWSPKPKLIRYFWEILTVSIAAQLGTFPVSIYYFHQFPGLFFITNLIIIPTLTVILGLGVIVVILASFDFVPKFITLPLEYSIKFINYIVNKVASIESFIIKDISMNQLMMLSIYLALISIIIWIKNPKFKGLLFVFISLGLFQTSRIYTKYESQSENEFIVFNVKKNSFLSLRKGKEVSIYANDSLLANFENDVTLKSYLVGNYSQVNQKQHIPNLLYLENKKILIIDSLAVYPKNCSPDLVIFRQSPRINLERFLDDCKPKIIVCDASNYKTNIQLWEATCKKRKIPFHATYEKGFYKLSL